MTLENQTKPKLKKPTGFLVGFRALNLKMRIAIRDDDTH